MLRHVTYKRNEKDFATKVVEDDASGNVTMYVDDKAVVTAETDEVTGGSVFSVGGNKSGLIAAPKFKHGIVRVGNLTQIAAALETATAASPVTALRLGDSTIAGAGSGDGSQWGGAAQRNSSAQFAALTNGMISNKSFVGDALMFSAPGYSVYNPSMTVGGGWGVSQSTLGGQLFFKGGGGGDAGEFRLALSSNAQAVRIYWLSQASTATIQTDKGVLDTLPTTGTGKIEYFDVVVQPGAAYVELVGATSTLYVLGMAEIDSTQKMLLLNAGANGAKVSDFVDVTNQWSSLNVLKKIAPKLTIINLTINDANAATAIAAYQSGLALLAESAMLSGDVVIELGAVSNTDQSTDGTLYAVRKAALEIADAYNLTVISDPAALNGSFANANANVWMADNWHPTYSGYTQIAQRNLLPLWGIINSDIAT